MDGFSPEGNEKQYFGSIPGGITKSMPEFSGNLTKKLEPRNCWLCEGWTQAVFEVTLPNKLIGCEVSSVYIHLSFEDFRPMVMKETIPELESEEDEKPIRIPQHV